MVVDTFRSAHYSSVVMTTKTVETALREAAEGMDAVKAALNALADDVAQRPVEFLTAKQVADYLHITTQYVYDMARSGRLPVKKVGTRSLFPASAVRELVE